MLSSHPFMQAIQRKWLTAKNMLQQLISCAEACEICSLNEVILRNCFILF